jgi:hypothetical protein
MKICQASPSGGRYSILNRDFSLKTRDHDESARLQLPMTSQLRVDTGSQDEVDFQRRTASHSVGNELLKEANLLKINGRFLRQFYFGK